MASEKDTTQPASADVHVEQLQTQSSSSDPAVDVDMETNDSTVYRTYKRRWFGLLQLVLLNIIVSWDVSVQQTHSSDPMLTTVS